MESQKVKDYMTKQPVTFTPDMSLATALEKVIGSEQFGGPVIDDCKQVIGFLSEQDLIDKLVKVSYYCQDSYVVGDCMSTEVLSVDSNMPIIELASRMTIGKPKVYPVIDDGKLVGLITRRAALVAIDNSLKNCFKHPV
ncbi:CBS domain-containing protein [Vibrio sp. RC27]